MTLDQAIKEVQQIAGWRSDKADLITLMLQYAQDEREKPNSTFPWFLRTTNNAAITTAINVAIYPLPTGYIEDSEEEEGNLYFFTIAGQINSRTVFLKKQSFKQFQIRYYGEWPWMFASPPDAIADQSATISSGVPIDYVLRDTDVVLGPIPNGVYVLSWRYWSKDTVLTTGQTNKWLTNAPWCLIGDAALKLCSDLKYADGVSAARAIKDQADSNLFKAVINRQEAGRRRSLGSKL